MVLDRKEIPEFFIKLKHTWMYNVVVRSKLACHKNSLSRVHTHKWDGMKKQKNQKRVGGICPEFLKENQVWMAFLVYSCIFLLHQGKAEESGNTGSGFFCLHGSEQKSFGGRAVPLFLNLWMGH